MGEIITRSILVGITLLITSCNFQNSATAPNSPDEIRVSRFVDPFIGTGGHGHTFPGASRPFGMIQLSPDNGRSGWDWSSGYHYSDSIISGFSHLHLSGTGIGDLSDILFMPINKEVDLKVKVDSIENIPYSSKFKHSTEEASPGFYTVYLEDHDIKVSLTTTERTGYHKYEFKKDELQSLVIDLGFAINWDRSTDSQINIEDATTISGYRFSTGWAENQKVFFVAELSKPITKKRLVTDGKEVKEKTAKGRRTAAQLFFDAEGDEELKVKVALSSVSINNARENLDKVEFNFEEIKEESAQVWENSLRDIEIKTEVDSLKTIFYSSLYHTKLAPVTFNDKNGEL
ncbi:MAG TPA: glycoside hydrolase domain-containing protein, partial [Salinimicrobium sp.]|nr:glycoside hydrolase domain-containing protein [Salinimicrobium sp.]